MFVITTIVAGIKFYSLGEEGKWTPLPQGAKIFDKLPDWITSEDKIEEL